MTEFLGQFQFNWYSIPVTIVSTFIFCIGLFVFSQHRKSIVNFSFFIICLCVNAWLYGISLVSSAKDPQIALLCYKTVTFLGVAFVSPCVYCFSVVWLKLYEKQKVFFKTALLGGALFYLLGLMTELSFPRVQLFFWGYYPRYGSLSIVFLLFFFGFFFAAFFNFASAYLKETDSNRKTQIKLIAVAFMISLTGSVDYIPKVIGVSIYPFGYLSVFFWIMTVAYSIVKYKVMDIETVIHKTLMWAVLSSLVFLPLGGTLYYFKSLLFSLHPFLVSFFGVVLFFLFMIYAKTIQPWIDHIFQRRKSDLKNELLKFNDNLVHLKGLSDLTKYIVQTIRDILYVNEVQLFLKKSKDRSLIRLDAQEAKTLDYQNRFVQWLEKQDRPVLADFLDLDPQFEGIKEEAGRFFIESGAKVSVPLTLNNELIGLINLGPKANLKPFRSVEVMFLSELRRAATIALSNSLRLIEMQESLRKWNEELEAKVLERTEQLKETQKQLIQAEKLATIGVLAGGVAHEINNPLTAVLTNAQILKMNADKDDLESIQLIEAGAKRCQEIIQKIMKYARKPLGPEKAEVVNLNDVIDDAIAFLRYQIEQENVEIKVQKNEAAPFVQANGNELEQVLTNLILNAKDAVKDVNRPGKIEIKTLVQNGTTGFSVSDNGHGISDANLSKIFDPFFTTKDVGKGTGLGLAVTYGIVKKYNGQIDVSSKVGKGTTFVVMFPCAAK